MSESQPRVPTLEEFIVQRKQFYHDEAIRVKTLAETQKNQNVAVDSFTFWAWFGTVFDELESLYSVLDTIMNDNRFAISLSKSILGFSKPTPSDELTARAKEIGEFSNILIDKKKEWEQENKEKEGFK